MNNDYLTTHPTTHVSYLVDDVQQTVNIDHHFLSSYLKLLGMNKHESCFVERGRVDKTLQYIYTSTGTYAIVCIYRE